MFDLYSILNGQNILLFVSFSFSFQGDEITGNKSVFEPSVGWDNEKST